MIDRLNAALEGRYRIERELGEGGMATVYLAQDVKHKRNVALKVLRPELAAVVGGERFLAEIETTANLQHPHILPLFDSGEADGFLFYVMPYVEGESLRDRIEEEHQLPVDEAVKIAEKIGAALQYAHEQDVVHRDIKPANILVSRGEPLVADFGIALALSEAGSGRITETGLSLGTPHYMSPEQAAGERTLDKRSDVYALACVLYEMLTGQPPYGGPTAQAVLGSILTGDATPPRAHRKAIPVHVEHAILKALEKLPADRFETAGGFVLALNDPTFRWREDEGASAVSPAGARRWKVATGVLGAAVLGLAGLLAFGGGEEPRVERQRVLVFPGERGRGPAISPLAIRYGIALGPDGAMVTTSSGGGPLLLKEKGEVEGVPLSGTEGGFAPTFSPDGRWIAFHHNDHGLRKVPRRGGAPITLADSITVRNVHAAWLDDGTLVFITPGWGLGRVDQAGGPVEVVMSADDQVGGDAVHVMALPDARGVLYAACEGGCNTAQNLGVVDLASGEAKVLVEGALGGWYVPDTGHLLYARPDGGVFAAPFDLDELEITGPELPVLEGVITGGWFAAMQVGRDGTMIYLAGENYEQAADEQIVWVDRSGDATPVDQDWWSDFESLALSPDGRLLAVTDESDERAIWVKELPDGPLTRLTPEGAQNRRPVWMPDGRHVAYLSGAVDSDLAFVVRRADASTEARPFLELPDTQIHQIDISRDGRYVVYRINGVPDGDLRYAEIQGGDTVHHDLLVREGSNEKVPELSPDARWLAYVSDVSGTDEVYVRPFPDVMSARVKVSEGGGWEPLWSHDGSELFYMNGDGMMVAAAVETEPTFRITAREELFQRGGEFSVIDHERRYDVAEDGRFLMVAFRGASATQDEDQEVPELILVKNWFTEIRRIVEDR